MALRTILGTLSLPFLAPTLAAQAPASTSAPAREVHWPQFRGPRASGLAEGFATVSEWDVAAGKNVLWRTAIPGLAHSSPVVWGERIFLTTAVRKAGEAELKVGLYGNVEPVADEGEQLFQVLCVDRGDGKLLWTRTAFEGKPRFPRHPKGSFAASTPATDGAHVVSFFGTEGLFCHDADGKPLWKKTFGELDAGWYVMKEASWGFSSSPVIHAGVVYVQCDVQQGSFLAALKVEDGSELGAYRFVERSAEAGLNNPPMTARPEGAQFVDTDGDGDMDLYSNGTLYQNRSEDAPAFVAMEEQGSGIGLRGALDEGAAFFDYDLDGDQDLFIVYSQRGTRFWEARGDGTYFQGEGGIIDEPRIGLDLGLSAEDWDNDGDVDFTTRQVFRQNRFVEDGARHFTVATHSIPGQHLTSATPAWGDWDADGDLDCALGNWQSIGHFYENVLWDGELPAEQRPYLRVRVAHDAPPLVPRGPRGSRGLETEYGAAVELLLHDDPLGPGTRRQKFVASGHGYLNQNEYGLHFALPPGPDEEALVEGLVVDLVVDFPARASHGLLRVDRHVNPALGDIVLADLVQREITVFRSGRVVIDGRDLAPLQNGLSPRLFATGGGLALPDPVLGLPDPMPAVGPAWVGIELVAPPPGRPVLVKELVLDGRLAAPLQGSDFNLALWDVTDPLRPVRVLQAAEATPPRNRRTRFPFVVALRPAHVYRCVALVSELRASPLAAGPDDSGLVVKGGLSFSDPDPGSGKELSLAVTDPARMYLALRYVTADPAARQTGGSALSPADRSR